MTRRLGRLILPVMLKNVVFVAPFPTDVTMRFVRACARLPGVRLLGVVHTPPAATTRRSTMTSSA